MIRALSLLALLAAPGTSEPPRSLPFVIDEVTGGHARIEADGEIAVIPASMLPAGSGEGTWVRVDQIGPWAVALRVDSLATLQARLARYRLQARLQRGPAGDLQL